MSDTKDLAVLSDAELDEVAGGFFNFATNFSLTGQSQTNVAIVALAGQGGSQNSTTNQVAVAL
jgi:hypothetical protein